MSSYANTLSCVSCGYELSHAEQSAREFCLRCRQERVFVLKEGSTTSFMGGEDFVVMSVYSREQAIQDGFLVDVSEWARHYGFRSLVTLTRDIWDHYIEGQPDEERAARVLLHAVKGPIQALVRLLQADPERAPVIDVEVRDRKVRVVLTADEGGREDVRIMFPEEE